MQIVITLPDAYAEIIQKVQNGSVASKIILEAVKGGIVLPKNHGDDDVRYLPAVIPATEGRIKERSY